MENIIEFVSSWVFWAITILIVVSVCTIVIQNKKMRRARERFNTLQRIRDRTIVRLRTYNHPTPTDAFLFIEEMIGQYGYTKEEIGTPLVDILEDAIVCQLKVLADLRGRFNDPVFIDVAREINTAMMNCQLLRDRLNKYGAQDNPPSLERVSPAG